MSDLLRVVFCKKPYIARGSVPVRCGQCMPCRIYRRRVWTHRLVLESFKHAECSFLTLTYNEENYPDRGSLVPEHYQGFLKRFRQRLGSVKLRYFFVGEYGDKTQRPHYHAALFGVSPIIYYTTMAELSWPYGYVSLLPLTPESSQYIVGYTIKKMTARDDERLFGRYPEFGRASRRPGLGFFSVSDVVSAIASVDADVPSVLKHGSKDWPLGRYMLGKIREELGIEKDPFALWEASRQMSKLFASQIAAAPCAPQSLSVQAMIADFNSARVARAESRYAFFNKEKSL